MIRHLNTEDIEEFELIRGIPRNAITDEILAGVANLNEITEIEIFLREIIADKTQTPHTATEIADILTTITYQGQRLFAAFVNKGKSTPNVTERNVAHQISRARRMPGINLIILSAVGNIQDDIKADLIQTARDANLDYMIVDAIDIARLFIAHHKICPQDGSPYEDGKCRKCGKPAEEPIVLTLRVYEEPRYNLLSQSDNSHGLAKRYSAEVWTDPHYPKSIIREVVKKITWDLRQSNYYRSRQGEERFGDRDADVVRLFLYLDEADRQTHNWVCRSLWINPDLPAQHRPMLFASGEWLGEIQIDWQNNYYTMREMFAKSFDAKGAWVRKIEFLLPRLEDLMDAAQKSLLELKSELITPEDLEKEFSIFETVANNIFRDATGNQLPPLDCKDCNQTFLKMASQCHNAFLPFATWGKQSQRTWQQKMWLVNDAMKRYETEKQDFDYEWRKVRR